MVQIISKPAIARWGWFECSHCGQKSWKASFQTAFYPIPRRKVTYVYRCADCHKLSLKLNPYRMIILAWLLAGVEFIVLYKVVIAGGTSILWIVPFGILLIAIGQLIEAGVSRFLNRYLQYEGLGLEGD